MAIKKLIDDAYASAELSLKRARENISDSFVAPGGTLGTPFSTRTDGLAFEQEKYLSGWVYVALRAIAQRVASQPVRVARVNKGMRRAKAQVENLKPLDQHPFLDLVDNPNPSMIWSNLIFAWVGSLYLTGRGLLLFDIEGDREEIWPIPTSWMTPIHVPHLYTEWRMQPPTSAVPLFIPADLIAHAHFTHPADPLGAISPLQAASDAVYTDHSIQRSQSRGFESGVLSNLAIVIGDQADLGGESARPMLEEEQRQQIINAVRGHHAGVERSGDPIILDSLVKDIKILRNNQEMACLESSNLTKERILQTFGVNPIIVGQVESASRAASAEADRHFCNSTVNPVIDNLSQVLTGWAGSLFAEDGETLQIWIEPAHPRDTEELRANVESLAKIGAVTPNEARALLMNLPPIPGGDKPLLPLGMIPNDSTGD